MTEADERQKTMKQLKSLPLRLGVGLALAMTAAAIYTVCNAAPAAAESKPAKTERPKKVQKKLTGAELYAVHCGRCHPERYPTERTDPQWRTILMHMRVRANLPAAQAKTILKYLQEESGN